MTEPLDIIFLYFYVNIIVNIQDKKVSKKSFLAHDAQKSQVHSAFCDDVLWACQKNQCQSYQEKRWEKIENCSDESDAEILDLSVFDVNDGQIIAENKQAKV